MTESDFSPHIFHRWFLRPEHSSRITEVLRRWLTELSPWTGSRVSESRRSSSESADSVAARVDWDPGALVAETEALVQRASVAGEEARRLWAPSGDPRTGTAGAMEWIRLDCGGEVHGEGVVRSESDEISLVLVASVADLGRGGMQLADLCREVVCRGAMPIGLVAVDGPEGDELDLTEVDVAFCELLGMDLLRSRWRRDDPGAGVGEPRWLVIGLVREKDHPLSEAFGSEGEAILLLGDAVGVGDERRVRSAPLTALELHSEKERVDALRMLIAGGRIRTAMTCGEGGVAGSVMRGVLGASSLVGASLDFTEMMAGGEREGGRVVRWDEVWLGERPGRVLVTTLALDAGKVLAQARILGIPAALVGWTGGECVRLRMPAGEVEWRLDRLKACGP